MPFTLRPFRRFPVQSLVTIAILFLVHTPVHAGLCMSPAVQKDSPYQYILSLTDALSYAKSALDRIPKDLNSLSSHYDLLLGLKLGKVDYECAGSQVSPYAASSTEAIQISAQGAALVFARLGDLQEQSVAQHTALLNSIGAQRVEPGTILEREAELGASYDAVWKLLIPAATAATYSVVEEDPTTGRMSGLALTAKQRDEILQRLRSTFGEEITKGMQEGQISLVAAAAVLYEVIGNQPRKTRDSK
jgi:hypothetical protein